MTALLRISCLPYLPSNSVSRPQVPKDVDDALAWLTREVGLMEMMLPVGREKRLPNTNKVLATKQWEPAAGPMVVEGVHLAGTGDCCGCASGSLKETTVTDEFGESYIAMAARSRKNQHNYSDTTSSSCAIWTS